MTTIPTFYSSAFINDVFGLVTGTDTTTPAYFPSEPVGAVNIQTWNSNKASFFVGTPTRVWWELAPNEETGWFNIQNLNQLQFYSVSGSAERLAYWIKR